MKAARTPSRRRCQTNWTSRPLVGKGLADFNAAVCAQVYLVLANYVIDDHSFVRYSLEFVLIRVRTKGLHTGRI